MTVTRSFGTWAQRRRETLGLTRDELAHAIGCPATTIRTVETSRHLPPPHVLTRLTSVLTEPNKDRVVRRSGGRLWNLPAQLTSFIGRERELSDLIAILRRPDVRLVTLTGPGGSGKSRLALQAAKTLADTFIDGCCFVDLAPLTAADQVAGAIARALSVRGPAEQTVVDSVIACLRPKQLLLLLDNYEHLPTAAGLVGDILSAAPGVKALVTSRVALQLYGEHELPLAPLGLPDPHASPGEIHASDAVRLFVSRADGVYPTDELGELDTAAIATICRRLDGLPLAIELAAAQVKRFAPTVLLEHLETLGALSVLAHGPRNVPTRQQTIRAAIDWSFDLLSPAEQSLFACLGVFAGRFDAEAVAAVCGTATGGTSVAGVPPALEHLVSQNLVQAVSGSPVSFVMLETIREYALERLRERCAEHELRDRHLGYYMALTETAEPQLRSGARQIWLERLDGAYSDIQAALTWGLAGQGDRVAALRLVGALWYYWRARGLFGDAARWCDSPALYDSTLPALTRARALVGLAWVAERQGTYHRMFTLALAALVLARQSDDRLTLFRALLLSALEDRDPQEAAALRRACLDLMETLDDPWLRCQALRWFGRPQQGAAPLDWQRYCHAREQLAAASHDPGLMSDLLQDRFVHAEATHDLVAMRRAIAAHAALAQDFHSHQALALTHEGRARLALAEGRWAEALAHQKNRLHVERDLGNRNGIGWAGLEISLLHLQSSDFAAALAALDDALENLRAVDEQAGVSRGLCLRSLVHLWRGDFTAAETDGAASLVISRTLGRLVDYAVWMSLAQWCLGLTALAQGQLESTDAYFAQAAAHMRQYDDDITHRLDAEAGRALVASLRGEHAAAAARMESLMPHYRDRGSPIDLVRGLWCQAPVLLAAGAHEAAEACCIEGLTLTRQMGLCPWSLRLLELWAASAAMRERPDLAARWWGAAADLRERIGAPLWPVDRPEYEARVTAARAMLGAEAFAAAFAAGRSLGWEQLVDGRNDVCLPAATATTAEELARELAAAAAIQAGLLPATLPEPRGWRVAALLIPAHETAGDFYDCIALSDGRVGLVIADVAGKGLGPALYMATGRALIRTLVGDGHIDPADVLARVNAYLLKETHADLFITLFYGVLDPARGTLVYANAGHPPPLVVSARGPSRARSLRPTGLVLGVERDATWTQQTIQLAPGDVVLLYTDGVTEAQDCSDGFFETERLVAALRSSLGGGAEATVAGVLAAVRAFAGGAPQSDDITLLAAIWDSP